MESVLGQTFGDLECIVVDDGSTDDTARLIASFSDPRVVSASTPHIGVSGARNRGLDMSRGDLIAFLDADDRWRPGKLERQVAILDESPDVDMVFTNFVRFTAKGKWLPDQFTYVPELAATRGEKAAAGGIVLPGDPFDFLVSTGELAAWIPTIVVRRRVTESVRFPLGVAICEDLHYILNIASNSRRLAYLPEPELEVRRHGENAYEPEDVGGNLVSVLRMLEKDPRFAGRASFRFRLGKELSRQGTRLARKGEFRRAAEVLGDALRIRESRPLAVKAFLAFPLRWLRGVLEWN